VTRLVSLTADAQSRGETQRKKEVTTDERSAAKAQLELNGLDRESTFEDALGSSKVTKMEPLHVGCYKII